MAATLSRMTQTLSLRAQAFPFKALDNLPRTVALYPWQQRNGVLDAIFYNVGVVEPDELGVLAFWLAREGALLIVPPSGGGKLAVCLDKEEFFREGGAEVGAIAVAGVGSSAIGAAAFARDIANALDVPVAAVVSGYGLSDVLTEALGGFFWFGALNSLRHAFEGLDKISKRFTASERVGRIGAEWVRLSEDTATLIDVLADPRFKAPFLIGHSKGNLVLSEALYALQEKGRLTGVAARSRIITFSAKVGMPAAFKGRVFDVMGQWDAFGALNSRPDIPADLIVPGAWHSTNPEFPWGMGIDVTATMKKVLRRPDDWPTPFLPAALPGDLPQLTVGALA